MQSHSRKFASLLKKFISKDEKFESSKLGYQIRCIRYSTINISLLIIIYFISILVRETYDLKTLVGLPLILVLSILVHLSTFKATKNTFSPLFFLLYLIMILIGAYNFLLKYFSFSSKKEVFMGGFVCNFFITLSIQSRIHTFMVFLVQALNTVLICLFINIDEPQSETSVTSEIPLVTVSISVVLITISYSLENWEKVSHFEKEKNLATLEGLKRLIKFNLPDQVFILPSNVLETQNIYFHNLAADQAFESTTFNSMISMLEYFDLDKFPSDKKSNTPINDVIKLTDYIKNFKKFASMTRFMSSTILPRKRGHKIQTKFEGKNKATYFSSQPFTRENFLPNSSFLMSENNSPTHLLQGPNLFTEGGGGGEKNPFVEVQPENEIDECEEESQELSSLTTSKEQFDEVYEILLGHMPWENDDQAIIVIIREISYQNQINMLEELHEMKDMMMASVTHDLRTPLNGIIGLVESVIAEENQEPYSKEILSLAVTSAKSLQFLINDLLDTAQIRKGKLSLNISEFAIGAIVNPVLSLIEYTAKKKNLKLIFENLTRPGLLICADINRSQQVLMNLLGNAIKFTRDGFIKLRVSENNNNESILSEYQCSSLQINSKRRVSGLLEVPVDEVIVDSVKEISQIRTVLFEVEDSGIGIKKEDLGKLFKPFGKLRNHINPTGVGLGLNIAQKLVKLMNPETEQGIRVRSDFGKGSKFTFKLKAVALRESITSGDCSMTSSNPLVKRETTRDFEKCFLNKGVNIKKVLIVDDDPVNLLVVTTFLKEFKNLKTFTATNGQEALDLIQKNSKATGENFDIIFMDCNMPLMSGFESTEKINEMAAKMLIPKPKIVALTGYSSQKELGRCSELGMSVLVKPLNRENFQSFVRTLI